MTLGEIYIYINAMIAKEVEGNTFNPATFNAAINNTNIEMFKDEFDLLEKQAKAQGKQLYDLLFTGSPLRTFTEVFSGITTGGQILLSSISSRFEQLIACLAIHNGIYKDVDIVDVSERNYRKSKLDGMLILEQPIVTMYKDRLKFLPTNLASTVLPGEDPLEIIYLRMPTTPVFDYYIKNDTGKVHYFPPGYWFDGDKIYNNNGVLVASDVTVPGAIGTPYYSASVELEWKTSSHGDFIRRLLMKAGIPIRDAFIIQGANADQR